jgi:hypothetical protein
MLIQINGLGTIDARAVRVSPKPAIAAVGVAAAAGMRGNHTTYWVDGSRTFAFGEFGDNNVGGGHVGLVTQSEALPDAAEVLTSFSFTALAMEKITFRCEALRQINW